MLQSKNLNSFTLLLGLALTTCSYAAADGTYVTGQVGIAAPVFDGAGPYFHFALGDQFNPYVALEAGTTAIPTTSGDWDGVARLYSIDGDVKGILPIGSYVNLFAKLGPSLAYFENDDKDEVRAMANGSIGIGFNLADHWTTDFSVGTMVGTPTIVLSTQVGIGYHFA